MNSAVTRWLANLELEAQSAAENCGGMRGSVRPEQRMWSRALDQIEAERQKGAA